MKRICKFMGTIHKLGIGYWILGIGRRHRPYPISNIQYLLFLFFALPLLSSCASTRPVVKIGLLAPFEGVYRQEGYDALAAMRGALAEQNLSGLDVLPLALDSSGDVVRAGQKVLADPSVAAVIGPFWAMDGLAAPQIFSGDKWLPPYAPSGDGAWAKEAVEAAAAFAEREGRTLVLAGIPAGWQVTGEKAVAGAPEVTPGDAVLWLGDAAEGADFARSVWEMLPDTPIGLYAAGVGTFRQRVGGQMTGPLFVVGWIDDDYPAWAASHSPSSPAAYTVYRQTSDILRGLADETITTAWQPAIFTIKGDGTLLLSPAR
jgi:hypothetical protein